jgi:hypothetical protein
LIRIRVDPRDIRRALYELLKSDYGRSLLTQISYRNSVRGLSVRNVQNIKIPIVNEKRFLEYRKAAEKLKEDQRS